RRRRPPDAGGVLDGVPLERLLGVLRLAHQLDAARLKGCLAAALAAAREYSSLPEYATFRSTRFQAGGVEWRLAMHPCGRGDSDGTHLSLYLECKERAPRPVIASFTLRLRGFPGVLTIQESFKWCAFQLDVQDDGHWCSWGTSTFLELDALHDPYHGYLAGDALRIEVDITMHEVGRGAA
ncbi:MAG: TRAF-like protein, partial [Monoraphidium minutum]